MPGESQESRPFYAVTLTVHAPFVELSPSGLVLPESAAVPALAALLVWGSAWRLVFALGAVLIVFCGWYGRCCIASSLGEFPSLSIRTPIAADICAICPFHLALTIPAAPGPRLETRLRQRRRRIRMVQLGNFETDAK